MLNSLMIERYSLILDVNSSLYKRSNQKVLVFKSEQLLKPIFVFNPYFFSISFFFLNACKDWIFSDCYC